jgi:hypothetical protein
MNPYLEELAINIAKLEQKFAARQILSRQLTQKISTLTFEEKKRNVFNPRSSNPFSIARTFPIPFNQPAISSAPNISLIDNNINITTSIPDVLRYYLRVYPTPILPEDPSTTGRALYSTELSQYDTNIRTFTNSYLFQIYNSLIQTAREYPKTRIFIHSTTVDLSESLQMKSFIHTPSISASDFIKNWPFAKFLQLVNPFRYFDPFSDYSRLVLRLPYRIVFRSDRRSRKKLSIQESFEASIKNIRLFSYSFTKRYFKRTYTCGNQFYDQECLLESFFLSLYYPRYMAANHKVFSNMSKKDKLPTKDYSTSYSSFKNSLTPEQLEAGYSGNFYLFFSLMAPLYPEHNFIIVNADGPAVYHFYETFSDFSGALPEDYARVSKEYLQESVKLVDRDPLKLSILSKSLSSMQCSLPILPEGSSVSYFIVKTDKFSNVGHISFTDRKKLSSWFERHGSPGKVLTENKVVDQLSAPGTSPIPHFPSPPIFKYKGAPEKIEDPIFITWDIEAIDEGLQVPWVICAEVFSGYSYTNVQKVNFIKENCVSEFVSFIKSFSQSAIVGYDVSKFKSARPKKVPPVYLLSFNGSNYDNLLIFNECTRQLPQLHHIGSQTSIKFMKYENLSFIDVRNHLSGSLNLNAEKLLGVEHQKSEFNFKRLSRNSSSEIIQECIEYCELDVSLTSRCFLKYIETTTAIKNIYGESLLPQEILARPTNSSLSFHAAQRLFNLDFVELSATHPIIEYYSRKSYFGGITSCYKTLSEHPDETILGLDINSSYPSSCSNFPLPIKPRDITNYPTPHTLSLADYPHHIKNPCEFLFIVDSFEFPKSFSKPNLPVRTEIDGNQYPLSHNSQVCYFGPEVFLALQRGCIIKVNSVISWHTSMFLKPYMDSIYALRNIAKKESNEAQSNTLKLFMNGLTGYFGKNIDSSSVLMTAEQFYKHCDTSTVSILEYEPIGELFLVTLSSPISDRKYDSGHLVHVVSAITSLARANLMSAIYNIEDVFPNSVLYTDTDSILVDVPVPCPGTLGTPNEIENLNTLKRIININNFELGAYKIEKYIRGSSYIGIAPKIYKYYSITDKKESLNIKGICKGRKIFTPDEITHEDIIKSANFEQLLNGESVTFTQTQFNHSIHGIQVFDNFTREVKPVNTKRIVVNNYLTLPYETI